MVHPRKKNTALHSALSHNQQGLIIDYLLQLGANPNAVTTKGYNPLLLAIVHGRPGTLALEKLLDAGAAWDAKSRFQRGKFSGLTVVEVAEQCDNLPAVALFQKRIADQKKEGIGGGGGSMLDLCLPVGDAPISEVRRRGFDMCPICQRMVKFPSKMSFLESDQANAEQEWNQRTNNQTMGSTDTDLSSDNKRNRSHNHNHKRKKPLKKIYTSRTYLDQLLSHSSVYKKLCSIEYHGLGKNKLRKEVSESYSIIHAIQECHDQLLLGGQGETTTSLATSSSDNNAIHFENLFVIDLCSGKGVTTAICGALFPIIESTCTGSKRHNNHFLAMDKLPTHLVPHFLQDENVSYLSRNIMSEDTLLELEREVHRQTTEEGRTAILVGMHLCGHLSERAIEMFERIPLIRAIILSPCCLPKVRSDAFEKCLREHQEKYDAWAHYLKEAVQKSVDDTEQNVRLFHDSEIHSIKNAIIIGRRK